MPKTVKKRQRRPRLSLDPAEHRSQFKLLAAAEKRSEAFIILKLATERLNQLLAENALPKDKVVLIPLNGDIQLLDTPVSEKQLAEFFGARFKTRELADGRRLFHASHRAINVRASLALEQRLLGPAVIGPQSLLPA